jgi:hypothetical protein
MLVVRRYIRTRLYLSAVQFCGFILHRRKECLFMNVLPNKYVSCRRISMTTYESPTLRSSLQCRSISPCCEVGHHLQMMFQEGWQMFWSMLSPDRVHSFSVYDCWSCWLFLSYRTTFAACFCQFGKWQMLLLKRSEWNTIIIIISFERPIYCLEFLLQADIFFSASYLGHSSAHENVKKARSHT